MKNIITYITYYHIDLGISTTVSVFVMKKCYTLAVPHFGQAPKYQNVGYPLLQSPILSHISTGLHPTGSPYHRGMPYRRGTQCSVSATSLQRHAAWQLLPWRGWMTWRLDDGVPPNHFFSWWIFPYKPSIFGVPPYIESPFRRGYSWMRKISLAIYVEKYGI